MPEKKPKDPLVAMLLSFLLTGLGQIYLGKKLRGLLWIAAAIAEIAINLTYTIHTSFSIISFIPILPVLSMIDAYMLGKKMETGQTS